MKKAYTLAGLLLLATGGSALAQGTELFFSEYDEGAQQNGVACPGASTPSNGVEKALEFYNPTINTVNLDPYSIRRYSNGATTVVEEERVRRTLNPTTPSTAANVLTPSTPYVYANGRATLTSIVAVADQQGPPAYQTPGPNTLVTGGPAEFNGNDALALVRWTGSVAGQGTPVIVDIFGIIGNDPGTQWSGADPNSGDFVRSANQSLKRRANISMGNTTWNLPVNPSLDPANFNIADEWEMYSTAFPTGQPADPCGQSYADLGSHTYTGPNGVYTPNGLLEDFNNAISFYPNPAHGRVNVSLGDAKVGQLTVVNMVGQSIVVQPGTATTTSIDVSSLKAGLYFVRCTSADGKITIYKELVVQ